MNDESDRTGSPGKDREFLVAGLIILLFVIINFLVAQRTPTVWVDEPGYTDPAANLYLGSGFTSTMWAQDRHAFWTGNVPLYEGLLYCAFKLSGFGLFQARAVNTLLVAGAGFLIWLTLRRARLVTDLGYRLASLVLILSGAVSTLTFRTIRPDATMFAVCALVFSAFFIRSRPARFLLLFISSALLPASGLAMLPYATFVPALCLCVFGFRHFREAACILLGLLGGIGGLALLYRYFSSIRLFMGIIAPFTIAGDGRATFKERLLLKIFGENIPHSDNLLTCFFGNPLQMVDQRTLFDYGAALLFFLIVLIFARQRKNFDQVGRRFFVFMLAVTLLVPPAMHFLAHYRSPYRWMTYIPLCIAAPYFMQISRKYESRSFRRFGIVMLVLAAFLGVPLRTVALAADWSSRFTGPINSVASQVVKPSDVVVCYFKEYFAIRPRAKLVYATGLPARGNFLMTVDLPADEVSLLCLQPQEFESISKIIGGSWAPVPLEGVEGAQELSRTRYNINFYRRVPEREAQ